MMTGMMESSGKKDFKRKIGDNAEEDEMLEEQLLTSPIVKITSDLFLD